MLCFYIYPVKYLILCLLCLHIKGYNSIPMFLTLHIYPLEWLLMKNTSVREDEGTLELLCTFGENIKKIVQPLQKTE